LKIKIVAIELKKGQNEPPNWATNLSKAFENQNHAHIT
jgi:hypothetical protein